MPTTVTGTPYTTTTTTLPMGDQAIRGLPDAQIGVSEVPFILYCHGDGGAYDQFSSIDAWTGVRTWLIDNGWGWVESAGAGISTWGSPDARLSYEQALEWAAGAVDIGPVVVLGRSMGGLAACWLYTQSEVVSDYAAGLIIASGVTDLHYRYHEHATVTKQEDMRAAYGAATDAEWDTLTIGHDPMLWPPWVWSGAKILQLVGTADDNVTPEANAYAVRNLWRGQPTIDELVVRQGGDHESSNGTFYEVDAVSRFLIRVTETPPATAFTVTELQLAGESGARYPLTIGEQP